ncbi:MAG: DUF6263 family protein [Planctomycetaceae bacterium]|nr:DUF6263 family protein [Planctomycetaceae bacterium]
MRSHFSCFVILAATLVTAAGCGQSASQDDVAQADQDLMSELLGDIDLTEGRPQEVGQTPADASAGDELAANFPEATAAWDSAATSVSSAEQFAMRTESSGIPLSTVSATTPDGSVNLALRLKFGDRFSLVKTVQQTLTQKSATWPAAASTSLELHMDLEVQQVRSDASLLRITYTRIRYQHDINGQQQTYDSAASPPGGTTAELAVYAGMVNNGFSFWLGSDNTIRELVGYNIFLQRCVAALPVQQQAAILAGISDRFGTEGVAGFVDDSIGILPYRNGSSTPVAVGDIWTRERTVNMPAPVQIKSTCQLMDSSPSIATIQVTETLVPAGPTVDGTIVVQNGRSMATCRVDRTTGMPVDVNRSTFVALQVTTTTGESVAQEKQITTRVQSSLPATRSVVGSPVGNSAVRQASGQSPGQQVTPIPTAPAEFQGAPLSSTATAVY